METDVKHEDFCLSSVEAQDRLRQDYKSKMCSFQNKRTYAPLDKVLSIIANHEQKLPFTRFCYPKRYTVGVLY